MPARGPGGPPVGAPAPAAGPARLEHRRARLPRRAPRVRHRSPARRRHPALTGDIALPDSWQADLRTALETPASAPADRESVRQRWADNDFRRYLGIDPMQIRNHTTGHGDLRWTHLTKTSVVIFD
ncbi:hypothetical protein TPA0910_12400 [Streptomyces hygroscopicus subsp. sporocinereus]|uniref:Uncharacterized protein n=1 Tax=Streptomyces hygroscopicus TaxID=1912 RepID=A0ABQ3TTZ7_STRHY|nr:hypothetical protein [Streptomyces hygroscopicus]GHJ26807.1 hypothetical protein TPA0910_12400 [Streptomyces hygroscopicus]